MKAQSLKVELLEWLNSIEDMRILSTLMQFKKATIVEDWAEKLTDDQLESLKRGISEMNDKKVISSEDFWKAYGN
ncbi:MAG: hypothetical protein EBQ94_01995 [Flavobacteriales bacterium]|jgi:hypothetical protein|nr:hypothetical protein [Crocinitomicaceae bacterium]NBX79141.1 hypothetical protein [Flavobacteriales bacterium]NCA21582.1 hypothetical protein [Crocinitomicaceae bacterium]